MPKIPRFFLYDAQHIVFKPKLLSAKELQLNVIRAYTKFYSMRRAFYLLFKLRLRNAMFGFMGYAIVKEWIRLNHSMPWLVSTIIPKKSE
jgi:hypothetical protein